MTGTRGDDRFAWAARGTDAGLNLNPSDARDRDADVTISGGGLGALLTAAGGAGDDMITGDPVLGAFAHLSATGGPGNDVLSAPKGTSAILDGASGDDKITGSRFGDSLSGGAGRDRIVGGDGADDIAGGLGGDELVGGQGATPSGLAIVRATTWPADPAAIAYTPTAATV